MSDDNKDLLRFATEYAEQNLDLYDMLGVDALTSKEDIHRAWRKRSLKYHPDKAGDNFDAAKWELFERARDVLADPNSRAAYDQAMKAKLLRKQEREAMDKERQKFADDLEARENAARRLRQEKEQRDREMLDKERERLAEANRMREEEGRRRAQAEQEMEDLAEAKRRLKEKKDEKARRKMAKDAMKGVSASRPSGPANGAVNVPGNYVVDLGSEKKRYWELVCDKLQAVQEVRNLQKLDTTSEELAEAERSAQEARKKIQEAELRFQRETAAS
ncbi:Pre-mRNA-splicing factor cwf23 [Paramyrothecium foliicola]|nr:Pre-mRNA-splicing factor cwf23 [Paramyrothecium foliicola]